MQRQRVAPESGGLGTGERDRGERVVERDPGKPVGDVGGRRGEVGGGDGGHDVGRGTELDQDPHEDTTLRSRRPDATTFQHPAAPRLPAEMSCHRAIHHEGLRSIVGNFRASLASMWSRVRLPPGAAVGYVETHDRRGRHAVSSRIRYRRRPLARGAAEAGARQCVHALPGAGADSLDRLQHRAPQLLHELRAAGVLPGHRAGVPPGRAHHQAAVLLAGRPRRAGADRPVLPCDGEPRDRGRPLLHQPVHERAARLGDPAGRVRGGGAGADGPRGAGRQVLPPASPAGGLPLRPRRQPHRHRDVLAAVVRGRAARRLGTDRGHRVRGAAPAPLPDPLRRAGRRALAGDRRRPHR